MAHRQIELYSSQILMREMTGGRIRPNCAIYPFWMALMNVYPVVRRVNSFLEEILSFLKTGTLAEI
jgi:hypothetical protein